MPFEAIAGDQAGAEAAQAERGRIADRALGAGVHDVDRLGVVVAERVAFELRRVACPSAGVSNGA